MTLIRSLAKGPVRTGILATAVVALAASFTRPGLRIDSDGGRSSALTKDVRVAPAVRDNVASLRSTVSAEVPPTPPGGVRLARTAAIALLVPDVERAIGSLRDVGDAYGGSVLSLTDDRPDSDRLRRTAAVSLAVPSAAMDAALARIAALGGVRSRTETAEDVGTQIVDDDARLRNLRRTEGDMRAIMDRSGKIGEVLEAENQLSTVREQIETLTAEVATVRRHVAFASIAVELTADAPLGIAPEPSAAVRLADAWRSALAQVRDVSIAVVARVFIGIAFAPYGLAAALAVVALRRMLLPRRSRSGGG